jgi:hypothetical protein
MRALIAALNRRGLFSICLLALNGIYARVHGRRMVCGMWRAVAVFCSLPPGTSASHSLVLNNQQPFWVFFGRSKIQAGLTSFATYKLTV